MIGHLDNFRAASSLLGTSIEMPSTVEMIRFAIADDGITLSLNNKGMYNHVTDICERWNEVVDICNGRRGPHSPANATQRQTHLLETLAWFSRWKELHDKRVKEKHATEYNFFANESWFCIKSLLLGHAAVMYIYCGVIKGKSISPRTIMNTDTVEWYFGDDRGWWQHQQVDSNRIQSCGREGKYIQCGQVFSIRQQLGRRLREDTNIDFGDDVTIIVCLSFSA